MAAGRCCVELDHKWSMILCSGDGLKSEANLIAAGVPSGDAANLAHDLDAAERTLEPGHRALFSLFEGTVEMTGEPKHH